jgi:hypothetical protein
MVDEQREEAMEERNDTPPVLENPPESMSPKGEKEKHPGRKEMRTTEKSKRALLTSSSSPSSASELPSADEAAAKPPKGKTGRLKIQKTKRRQDVAKKTKVASSTPMEEGEPPPPPPRARKSRVAKKQAAPPTLPRDAPGSGRGKTKSSRGKKQFLPSRGSDCDLPADDEFE